MSNPSIAGSQAQADYHDRGPALLGFVAAFTGLAATTVGLRLTVRICIVKSPGWDDAAILIAITFALISTIFYGLAINSGYGRHILTLSESALASAIKWNLIATVTFSVSLIFSKVSVCFLFLRILGRTRTTPKVAFLYGMAALSAVIGFIAAGYTAGQCSPPEKDWDHDIPGKCHGDVSMHIAYAQAAFNTLIDFALALFPLTFLLHSNMHLRRKPPTGALMSCGIIAGICSIARIIVSAALVKGGDFTWRGPEGTYLGVTEETVSIVVACLPTLGPLVRVVRGKTIFGSSWRLTGRSGESSEKDRRVGAKGGGVDTFRSTVSQPEPLRLAHHHHHQHGGVGVGAEAHALGLDDVVETRFGRVYGSDVDLVPGIEKIMTVDVDVESAGSGKNGYGVAV